MREFKPLEQIADDSSVTPGDLLLVKETSFFSKSKVLLTRVIPLFY